MKPLSAAQFQSLTAKQRNYDIIAIENRKYEPISKQFRSGDKGPY